MKEALRITVIRGVSAQTGMLSEDISGVGGPSI